MSATAEVLSSKRVHEIFSDCLFKDGEPLEPRIEVAGIMSKLGLHPERTASHKQEIGEMLRELPSEFMRTGGGGWSFLNACMDRHGNHWAEHPTMELLFCLGVATEQAKYLMPREMWSVMPGGMPYVLVDF